jgi:hypothetical protein
VNEECVITSVLRYILEHLMYLNVFSAGDADSDRIYWAATVFHFVKAAEIHR